MADSTSPLSDQERVLLLRGFAEEDDTIRSRVTRIFYSTGMHPAVLARPSYWRLRAKLDESVIEFFRAKTRSFVVVPLDPAMRPWILATLEELETWKPHPVRLNQLVHAFGEAHGVPGLTPRTCRHDFSYRAVQTQGFIDALMLTGTTRDVLEGYAKRDLAKRASRDPRGLFG